MIIDLIAVLIALASLVTVYFQIQINTKTVKADFIYRLKNDFYSKKSMLILFFIEKDLITFTESNKVCESYFAIKEKEVKELPIQFKVFINFAEKSNYAIHIQEMDNFVLGYLEDIGEFYDRKIFDIKYISNAFGYYIIKVLENKAIDKYLKWDREEKYCQNDYKLFEKLAKEIQNK